jgi:hypothetical protein
MPCKLTAFSSRSESAGAERQIHEDVSNARSLVSLPAPEATIRPIGRTKNLRL